MDTCSKGGLLCACCIDEKLDPATLWEVAVKTRLAFIVGAGLGYVFGTRAGREKYERLAGRANELWQHPTVQRGVSEAEDSMRTVASEHLPKLAKRAVHAARDAFGMELPEH